MYIKLTYKITYYLSNVNFFFGGGISNFGGDSPQRRPGINTGCLVSLAHTKISEHDWTTETALRQGVLLEENLLPRPPRAMKLRDLCGGKPQK